MASQAKAQPAPPGGKAAAPPADDSVVLPAVNLPLMVFGVMTASVVQVIDTTVANVALPHMQSALGATGETITWVLTSYIIAAAIALPITGWLAERVGARRLLIISVAAFVGASMACGMAVNITQIVVFRALQGVAGAFIIPLGQSFMLDATRPSRHAQVLAMWSMAIMVGPIAGPVVGGYLTENWNWRWVFYINVPLGAIALGALIAGLPHRVQRPRKFDLFGFAFLSIALTAMQLLLDRGQQIDWFASAEAWLYAFLIGTGLWVFVIHMLGARNPLFETAIFRDRNLVLSMIFMLIIGLIMYATMALLPPLLQQLQGYDVIDTGMVMAPRGVGVLISMQIGAWLMKRGVDPRLLAATGFAIATFALWEMAHWSLAIDSWGVVTTGIYQGLGIGLVFIPLNVLAFSTLASRYRTEASSLLNLLRSIGSSIGISIVTVMLARNLQIAHADIGANLTSGSSSLVDLASIERFQSIGDTVYALAEAEITRQAAMVAYIDDFYMMMWLNLAAIPLCLLLRKPPRIQAT